MAILGVVTNLALTKFQDAQNNEGFKIYPTAFSVSDVLGLLDPTRTTPNLEWFEGPISSRVVVDYNTIKFICTIPPAATPVNRTIREIYIKGEDSLAVPFLMVIGQPSTAITYDPSGSVTLELDISLTNCDLSSVIVFNFTQATEISEHNTDPNAHPEIVAALNRAGNFLPPGAGGEPFVYRGQFYDEKAEFEGTQAAGTHGGVVWNATHNGTDGNLISLTFDGIKTTDEVRLEWNNANPYNTVEHNGTGFEVSVAGVLNLIGGTLLVSDKDVVYRDTDGFYKKALSDGSIKAQVAGIADFTAPYRRIVRSTGFIAKSTFGFTIGDDAFLSASSPGAISTVQTSVRLGIVTHTNVILMGGQGGGGGGTGADFDAIVTDDLGVNRYPTTAQAIANTPNGGRILVDKLEYVTATILPGLKRIDFWFNGPEAGWSKFLGLAEKQKITFSAVPTSGTWRIEWNGDATTDLAFNATALDVENAVNLLVGPGLPVTVTGNYTLGFEIVWTSFIDVPQITFNHLGQNEIQTVAFDNIPDNGTLRLDFDAQLTPNLAWNDNAPLFEVYLESLTNISDVAVTGSFGAQLFTIEWVGVDGKTPKNQLTIDANTLQLGLTPTNVVINTTQEGIYPASNLKVGANPILITVQTLIGGSPVGPGTCFLNGTDYTRFVGLGKIENFDNGIDLNGKIGVDIELLFNNVINPTIETGLTPGRDFHHEKSFGITTQKVRTVGTFGDHLTLWEAVAAANTGDKIVVMNDQTLLTNQIINKDIEITFTHGAQIDVPGFLSGNILSLGTKTKTNYMKLVISQAGAWDTIFNLTGSRGFHQDLTLEASNAGATITNAFKVDIGATAIYCHGILSRGSAVVLNGLVNASTYFSHDIIIRDIEGGQVLSTTNGTTPVQETPTGVVDGVNDTFLLSQTPVTDHSILVMVDSLPRFRNVHWTLTGLTLEFLPGFIPQLGQDVYVWFFPQGPFPTPPRHLESLDNNSLILFNTKKINFGTSLDVILDDPEKITVNVSPGGGLGTYEVVYHTVTVGELAAKQFTISPTPLVPAKVIVDVLQLGAKAPTDDFTITGAIFDWNGLGLDGFIAAGHKVRLVYFS